MILPIYENVSEVEPHRGLEISIRVVKFGLLPFFCVVALVFDLLFIATDYRLGLKRSTVLFMILVAATDILQAIGLIGYVHGS